jgi:DNA-binding MarR family transcriptional regulator
MDDLDWLEPHEHLVFSAYARSARALFVQFDRDLQRDVGLPRSFFEILWLLHEAPNRSLRMNELAEKTGSQASRITHAVSALEKEGQVRREHCADDRRGWFTVLTDKGLETLQHAAPLLAVSIRQHFFSPLSERERQQITAISRKLLRELGATPFSDEPAATSSAGAER